MTKVLLSNHTAVFVAKSDQDRIRKFYGDVLGCKVNVEADVVDRFQMGDVHFIFVYQDAALSADDFLKAIFLELKTDDLDGLRERILAFGVRQVEIPDPHFYFQAPGGQVFKLVGIEEDLSLYEKSTSSQPGASAAA